MSDGIEIDLSEARKSAELVRDVLRRLRSNFDLTPYEFTRSVRIAPGEIPHSHPTLTLNTMIRGEEQLLCTYLHEQMHWYVTWYSYANRPGWQAISEAIKHMMPSVPVQFPQGAHTEASSYLHIIINWLEVEVAAALLGRAEAMKLAAENFVYSGIYELVLQDWNNLESLYLKHGLVPIRPATEFSNEDLLLAARQDEAEG
ncbi:conserved hypothetical protein [Parvibaculum lavamentivorans DS-1]|uniref:Uncharacterized protein n=1 Tax=Parvibaculum lavamentivorans (strain DS-1 / DSM 13023 / NCIMB 13966) TaxID=402881 RepID=A7HQM7_PARL1|nr:hypothetical protein [Parvibaculum lavamentivorans]ABS62210.1 conserved hypothetical protein [Parvibaculum lavamentivorans DS-1]